MAVSLASTQAFAQRTEKPVRGVVRAESGDPIDAATIEILGSLVATRADVHGQFSVPATSNQFTLRVRRIGFHARTVHILTDTLGARPLTITLESAPAAFQQVLIVGLDRQGAAEGAGVELTRNSARMMPPLGEPDLLRSLPFIPNVLQPDDLSNRFHIAGSAADELLMTIDGHPLQSTTHASGALSSFNLAAVERASLSLHDVRANTDSRLGGLLAVSTRDASRPQREAVVSLISASGTVTQPLLNGRASVLLSARRTYLDAVLDRIVRSPTTDPGLVPTFSDALLRADVDLGNGWRASAISLLGSDERAASTTASASPFRSQEQLFGLRLDRASPRWEVHARISHSLHVAEQRTRPADEGLYDVSRRWLDGWIGAAYAVSPRLRARGGLGASNRAHRYDWILASRFNPFVPVSFSGEEQQSLLHGAVEVEATAAAWTAVAGTRATAQDGGILPAPRLSLTRRIGERSSLNLAAERRLQFDSEMGPPLAGQPEQPVFLLDRPRRMDGMAFTVESSQSLGAYTLAWSTSLFTRRFGDRTQPLIVDSATAISFARRDGTAHGGGLTLTARSTRGAALQAAYAYSASRQRNAAGDWERTDWDAPHTLSAILGFPLGQHLVISAALQWRSGLPLTPLASRVLVPGLRPGDGYVPRPVEGPRNSGRTASFSRLDVGLRRRWTLGRADLVGTLQVTNLLGRENALELDLRQIIVAPEQLDAATRRQGLPRVPSIGLEIRW